MDLLLIETGSGGDLVLKGNDIAMVEGVENMPYLCLFGGDDEWWGNELLFRNEPKLRMTSETEKVLGQVVLNSAGRIKIENAIKKDLADLVTDTNSDLTIIAAITAPDRLEIKINFNGKDLQYLWNPAKEFLTYIV